MSTNYYSIHIIGSCYSGTLYDSEKGDYIYDLHQAEDEAFKQHPNEEWEIYNGYDALYYNPEDN